MLEFIKKSKDDQGALAALRPELLDLSDDGTDYSKVVVKKPWGYEYLLYGNQDLAVWILFIAPGAETSVHCHPRKHTSLTVLKGEVDFRTLTNSYRKKAGQALLIEEQVFHQTCGVGKDGAYIMEIETPNNKRDLVRLRDRYGRQNMGYEDASAYSINTQNYNYISFNSPNHTAATITKKRLGECTLTVCRIKKGEALNSVLKLERDDILCLLRGTLKSGQKIGHAFIVPDHQLVAESECDVLISRRSDRLVKVSDYVAESLKTMGVSDVFLTPGDANVHLLDSIGRCEGLRFIALSSEREAALAAEAYAKTSGKLGALILSSGAAVPSAVQGIANCYIDSAPLLVLAGQSRSDQGGDADINVRQLGNKAFNAVELTKSITKYGARIKSASDVARELNKAATTATSGRPGPALLEFPIDIQGAECELAELSAVEQTSIACSQDKISPAIISAVIERLKSAKRPILLIGNGVRISGAQTEVTRLLTKISVPVLLSRRGADLLPAEHALNFGRPGTFGTRAANFLIQNADLLISVGCRQSIPLIGRNTEAFARGAYKINVDIDQNELDKSTIRPDLKVAADAKVFLSSLSTALNEPLAFDAWLAEAELIRSKFPAFIPEYDHRAEINPYGLLTQISEKTPPNAAIIIDGGPIMHRSMQVFKFKAGQSLISSTGLETPGFALSGAIGAAAALKKHPVVCLIEDRGFQACAQSLQTILDYKLDIRIVVLGTKGSAGVRNIQKDYFGSRFVGTDGETRLSTPPINAISALYGLRTVAIANPSEIHTKLSDFLSSPGPSLCEVTVDSEQELIPRMAFNIKPDGKWIAKPLEDMYPFLPRTELQQTMKIPILQED